MAHSVDAGVDTEIAGLSRRGRRHSPARLGIAGALKNLYFRRDTMKIAVLGGDGYCGWATALYLSNRGHSVAIIDNFVRRLWDHELGVQSLTPIRPLAERLRGWQDHTGTTHNQYSKQQDHD